MFVCLFVWFFRRDLYSDFRTITTTSRFPFFVNYKKIACLGVVIRNVVDNPLYPSSMTVGVVKTCYGNDGILVDENVELDLLSNDSCRIFFPLLYRPYHTLLFLVDERYLLASLAGDCSPAITRLVKMASPLKRYSLGCHMLFNNIDLASSL